MDRVNVKYVLLVCFFCIVGEIKYGVIYFPT